MTINLESLKPLLTKTAIGRVIAVLIALCGVPSLMRTAPLAMSSSGVPVDDLIPTMMPFVGAVLTWFGAGWLKVNPEVVQAVIAFYRDPKSVETGQRVDAAFLSMMKSRHANEPAVINAIAQLATTLAESQFPQQVAAVTIRAEKLVEANV